MRLENVANDAVQLGQAISALLLKQPCSAAAHRLSEIAERLDALSSGGLRDVIRMFRTFAWVANEYISTSAEQASVRIGDRILRRTPLATMVQVLGQLCRFSETRSKFPNIFLANDRSIINLRRNLHHLIIGWCL